MRKRSQQTHEENAKVENSWSQQANSHNIFPKNIFKAKQYANKMSVAEELIYERDKSKYLPQIFTVWC